MEADNSKQYSLRWEKHAFNLASEAGCFFEDESFLDCTLSAEGQCIEAHKIILSAASSYLSNLLKIMPDKHPILIFNDIKFEQLKSLVAFIYNGSVNISENNIHAFLNAAQSLLIKGLSEESKYEERISENHKKHLKGTDYIADGKTNCRKHQPKLPIPKKSGSLDLDSRRSYKKQRQILPRAEVSDFGECEENLSQLQEISITKYIHQNLNSKPHIKNELFEGKWNEPVDEKLKNAENYVVKSWKHNSVEDLNGRHKQNKGNPIKKIKLEKVINSRSEDSEIRERRRTSSEYSEHTGITSDRTKPEEAQDKTKRDTEAEKIVLVEPKQEVVEEEDTNSEYQVTNNDPSTPDSESLHENRTLSKYHHPPLVEKGIPVPLLMCRTSLSEPDVAESGWIPSAPNNFPPPVNCLENNSQDLQCQTCTQDLPCPTCTKKYKSRYALNRHILYECGKARKSFSCDECGKKVTRQDTLQKHKLIHLVQHLKKKESEINEEPKPKKSCS